MWFLLKASNVIDRLGMNSFGDVYSTQTISVGCMTVLILQYYNQCAHSYVVKTLHPYFTQCSERSKQVIHTHVVAAKQCNSNIEYYASLTVIWFHFSVYFFGEM